MDSYDNAKEYISEISKKGIVLGTDSEKKLLSNLGNPQKDIKIIHVAGTNGKGSVASFLAHIFVSCGYRTGLYRSPAVNSPFEIISVNGNNISAEEYADCISEVKNADKENTATSFEAETAAAFVWFKKSGCSVAVIEAGMGGRDDATNAVEEKECAVFAHISMDHAAFLGDTVKAIAENKSFIADNAKFAVSAEQEPEVRYVLAKRCEKLGIPIYFADYSEIKNFSFDGEKQHFDYKGIKDTEISLLGDFQRENAAVAIETAVAFKNNGFAITDEAISEGLSNASNDGRFDIIKREPIFITDGAHNADAVNRLMDSLKNFFPNKKYFFIMGIFKDKEYKKIIARAAGEAQYIFAVQPDNPRALAKDVLAAEIAAINKNVHSCEIKNAVNDALECAKKADGIVVSFGSLSFVADIKKILAE